MVPIGYCSYASGNGVMNVEMSEDIVGGVLISTDVDSYSLFREAVFISTFSTYKAAGKVFLLAHSIISAFVRNEKRYSEARVHPVLKNKAW